MKSYFSFNLCWLGVGLAGQLLFSIRFLIQWIISERKRKSIIPLAFWHFSMLGGITLLFYAIHQRDPVFIIGQASGLIVYVRNLYFIYAEKKKNGNLRSRDRIKSREPLF